MKELKEKLKKKLQNENDVIISQLDNGFVNIVNYNTIVFSEDSITFNTNNDLEFDVSKNSNADLVVAVFMNNFHLEELITSRKSELLGYTYKKLLKKLTNDGYRFNKSINQLTLEFCKNDDDALLVSIDLFTGVITSTLR